MHTSTVCSKQRAKTRMTSKSLDLNPIDQLLDVLKHKVRAQQSKLNLRELMRASHQMCLAIPHQYIHRHILSMDT